MSLSTRHPKFAAQAIRKVGRNRLEAASHPEQRRQLGGCDAEAGRTGKRQGLVSDFYLKDPTDPQWKDDPGYKQWVAFMNKYYPRRRQDRCRQRLSAVLLPDTGAGVETVRRRVDPGKHHEAGRKPARLHCANAVARASRSIRARLISPRSSRCRWLALTGNGGSCSGRCSADKPPGERYAF